MKNTSTTIITSAFIPKNKSFLIAKRADDDNFYPGYWELAGGKAEFGEHIEDAAAREIKEELGLDITAKHILAVRHYLHDSNPNKQFIELFFLGKMRDENQEVVLSHEHSEFRWVTFADINKHDISPYTLSVIKEIQYHPLIGS